jgi:glycosyltransferase involved in cell wall biosynthesis
LTKIRVLELTKGLEIGGSEMLLSERLGVRDSSRFDYAVAYLRPEMNTLASAISSLGVPVHCFAAQSSRDWGWVAKLRRYILDENVDIVHVHSPLMAIGVRAAVLSIGSRRPRLISTEHSFGHHPLTQILDTISIRLDDRVIAVSEAVAASLACRIARECEVIHHGVNVETARAWRLNRDELTKSMGLHTGRSVVCVANLRPEKGHETLLQAAAAVHERLPDVHFYLIGHGPTGKQVQAQIRRQDMLGYVHLLGAVPQAGRVTACADVFVLPSAREGRPVALMEALAARVPSVATAVGGVPDMVTDGENGVLVPPNDPESLATALIRCLEDAGLREHLARGAGEFAHRLDLRTASARIESIYLDAHLRHRRAIGRSAPT